MNDAVYAGKTDSDSAIKGTPAIFQRSGHWLNTFNYQGVTGSYWASNQYSATHAWGLGFYGTDVGAGNYNLRKVYGAAVRCIAI